MLTITLLWGGYGVLLIGIGLLSPWSQFPSTPSFKGLINSFWVGWALVVAFLQIWQIFWPIGRISLLILFIAALTGWILRRREMIAWVKKMGYVPTLFLIGAIAVVGLILSDMVIYDEPMPDHGLYHIQTVKWFISYALPRGLVNLHYRLAFNHSGFLFAAQIENGVFPGLAYYVVHPLLFGALLLQTAGGLFSVLRKPGSIRYVHLAESVLFFMTLKYLGEIPFSGYAPDRMVFILQAVLGLAIIDLFEKPVPTDVPFEQRAAQMVLLIGLGLTLKLSFAGYGLMTFLSIIFAWIRRKGAAIRQILKPALYAGGIIAIWFVPWVIRGVIMSGYPFFPSDVVSIPVTWRMAPSEAAVMSEIITNWARTCSNTMPIEEGKFWILTWKSCMPPRFWQLNKLAFLLLAAAAIIEIWRRVSKKPVINYDAPLVLLGICSASFLFWLWFGPDYRFAGAVFWLLLLATLLLVAKQAACFLPSRIYITALAGLGIILTVWFIPGSDFFYFKEQNLLYPPPAVYSAKLSTPSNEEIVAHSMLGGGTLYSPSSSGGLCWDAPLPCMQYNDVHPRLKLFDPDNLGAGFYIAPIKTP